MCEYTLMMLMLWQGGAPPWMQKTVTGCSVADEDLGDNDLLMTLWVDRGTFSLAAVDGLTFVEGDGTDDLRMQFTGRLPQVNAAIGSIVYTMGSVKDKGTALLTLNANDQGFTGLGGPMQDEKTVSIPLPVVNQAPVLTVPSGPDE